MSSPHKQSKLPSHQSRKLNEPLLPLHLALAWIIIRVFPINSDLQSLPVYSLQFTQKVLHIVGREILDVGSEPATFGSLKTELDRLVKAETMQIIKKNEKKRCRGVHIEREFEDAEENRSWLGDMCDRFSDIADGCSFIDGLDKELRERLNYGDDDEPIEMPPPIERHSPLGIFCRNLINILRKLSFDETAHLSREISKWCGIGSSGSSKPVTSWSLDRKSGMEDNLDKRVQAMQDYQAANLSADYSGALASLRRFYDYQFPSTNKGQHQHALLNIAVFHYSTGGLESARSTIDEAIRVARTAGDKACLQHCTSLSQRLETEVNSLAFTATETLKIHQTPIPVSRLPDVSTPMDELWTVKTALDLGEPVHIAFRRIYAALGKEYQTEVSDGEDERLYPKQWVTGQGLEEPAWHATQAGLWNLLGSNALANFHEELALSEIEPWNDGGLTVILAQAQRIAEKGEYDQALAVLLDIVNLHGITISQYHTWARTVWTLLERRATLNGNPDALSYLSSLQPPKCYSSRVGPGGPLREHGHPKPIPLPMDDRYEEVKNDGKFSTQLSLLQDHVRSSLSTATELQRSSSPSHLILPHVMSAVQLSSELGMWRLYRFGVVVLAEVMLGMEAVPLSKKAIQEIESVWSQLIASEDYEALARGALVIAKGYIELSLDSGSTAEHDSANDHLFQAFTYAKLLESRSLVMEITSLLALLSELRLSGEFADSAYISGSKKSRDSMVDAYEKAQKGVDEAFSKGDMIAREVAEVVKWVGVRIAEGWK
ncbi:anaphase-promoting complex subunit 5 [Cryptococcus neoformans Ze90-1]|nr:anaphase-promoting complex subunit 5 [Cryptococcus neoformans var. grubii Ze90-1]